MINEKQKQYDAKYRKTEKYKKAHREYWRKYSKTKKMLEYMRWYHKMQRETNFNGRKDKDDCRSKTKILVSTGEIKKGNCVVCKSKNVEAHHSDYAKPKLVIWLCRKHHLELHQKLKKCAR
jgi:hypothetical protein